MGMFNEEQLAHMKELDSIPPEQRCWCGWARLGECYNCSRDTTRADKTYAERMNAQCPECGADPPYHRYYCSKSN
jgi:hypothetical protein